jgi:hypothetical protein
MLLVFDCAQSLEALNDRGWWWLSLSKPAYRNPVLPYNEITFWTHESTRVHFDFASLNDRG